MLLVVDTIDTCTSVVHLFRSKMIHMLVYGTCLSFSELNPTVSDSPMSHETKLPFTNRVWQQGDCSFLQNLPIETYRNQRCLLFDATYATDCMTKCIKCHANLQSQIGNLHVNYVNVNNDVIVSVALYRTVGFETFQGARHCINGTSGVGPILCKVPQPVMLQFVPGFSSLLGKHAKPMHSFSGMACQMDWWQVAGVPAVRQHFHEKH
jgi:hypothetical protein